MKNAHVPKENVILILTASDGRHDICMGLAKLKKLKLLGMIEEKIYTPFQMLGSA